MNQWWGVGAVFVIGLVVIIYGWLSDRMAARRRAEALAKAPDRLIPGLDAALPTPEYVLAEELTAVARTLEHPQVLVTDAEITSIRELLPALRLTEPLLIVAAGFSREVAAELTANAAAGTKQVATLIADDTERARLCAQTGATEVPSADLKAGYLPPELLGHCERWEAETLK
jgi:hypothetical protein